MYKVFIENKPIIFHFNSQFKNSFHPQLIWQKIENFLKSNENILTVELPSEADFSVLFKTYKYIEAAGGIVRRGETYLFIKRNGFWDIPKGKLEKGESTEIAAVREIEEECGLVGPKIVRHLIDTWHTYPHKDKFILKRTYWYLLEEGDEIRPLIPQVEEGITEVEYIHPLDFEKIKNNTYASIIDVIDALEKI